MLCLGRRVGETIMIGDDIEIKVLEIDYNRIRLGITAPEHVPIVRAELLEAEDGAE